MAFFKIRWPGQKGQDSPPPKVGRSPRSAPAESVEAMRRRARHRLVGAAVLVLLGVVGFPVLFDTQPRPIPVDIPIEIPDRDRVAALSAPPAAEPASTKAKTESVERADLATPSAAPTASPAAQAAASAPARPAAAPAFVPAASAPQRSEPKPETKPEPKPDHKPEPKPEPKPELRPQADSEAARARALLEGRSVDKPAAPVATGRFIVQIGAYAEADKAREVRMKLERAGLKTYTQVAQTPEGKRIRVRVGPFEGRAEADKVAARIKALNLPVSVLSL